MSVECPIQTQAYQIGLPPCLFFIIKAISSKDNLNNSEHHREPSTEDDSLWSLKNRNP